MKTWFKTAPGKALLFLLCVIFVTGLALSVAGAVAFAGLDFYTRSETDICRELFWAPVSEQAEDLMWRGVSTADLVYQKPGGKWAFRNVIYQAYIDDNSSRNLCVEIRCDDGAVLALTTQLPDEDAVWYYTYPMLLRLNTEDGSFYPEYASPRPGGEEEAEPGFALQPLTISASVKEELLPTDSFRLIWSLVHVGYRLRYWIYALALGFLALAIVSFAGLMAVSARRPETETLCPGPLHKVPFDLMLAAAGVVTYFLLLLTNEAWDYYDNTLGFAAVGASALVILVLALALSMGAAGRIKDRSLLSGSAIAWCLRLAWRILVLLWRGLKALGRGIRSLVRSIPLVWRTILAAAVLSLVELVVVWETGRGQLLLLWFVKQTLLVAGAVWLALCLRKLQAGAQALARGDLTHHTDTRGMLWDLRQSGEDLNSIASGMAIAVEDRLRSERMKTELITNVSHDLKTPLTSIVNYARLIGDEPSENEKITQYAGVLVRQSERLRRLIDDLVEASKASTGNLEVHPVPCDAGLFLSQAAGEFEEKLAAAGLSLITRSPEEPVRILADSRRMWRIFDNLMNNVCKYGQSGTRVYLSLERLAGHAVITFKNTSRDPLDISEEELMERFVRGDSSRNTEGNGLGLSIARSLAELQGGSLRISIDGDLFKAILTFPLMQE